ncbi:clavesin-2 [Caerostris extrusa]|uniref:Clavesin-2 n=1 Tax=Caerostris extrusa TaxID=172846 RepID=A0AAV4RXB7_CAEEX|nr:clavesin-2 [Caerostris extrusa]
MAAVHETAMEKKEYLPFHTECLTPWIMQIAKQELNENEETRASYIEQLRKLVLAEKNLKCRMDDEFLLQFLRARKFSVEKAFTRLQTLFTVFSRSFPDVFADCDADSIRSMLKCGVASILPYRNEDGSLVLLIKMGEWDPSQHDAITFLSFITAALLCAVDNPVTQICGLHVLVDVKGTTVGHIRQLKPRFLYLISKGLRDTPPVRYKGIHLFNASTIFKYLWSVINIFLSEKLRSRVKFHDDSIESLHKFISKAILPSEYGGDDSNFDAAECSEREVGNFLPKYLELVHSGYVTK